MFFPRSPRMSQAVRLVREGRLGEATAALQGMLRGAEAAHEAPRPDSASARIVDVDPDTGAVLPPRASSARFDTAGFLGGLAGRVGEAGHVAPGHVPGAGGAQFTARTHTGAHGSRGYKFYVPSAAPDRPLPLIVMLHGCTQSPDDFAVGTGMNRLAEAQGFLVAYPGQTKAANAQKCWNWFNPADQRRDQGEPALIAGITREVMASHAVDPRRIYVAGLSAGGAAAAIMGAAYPELYAAVGVHSGLPCGAARDVPSAFAAMRDGGPVPPPSNGARTRMVPTIVFHADKDSTVHPRNAEHIIAQSVGGTGLQPSVTRGQVPGGRTYTRSVYADTNGRPMLERWIVHGGGHAWSGGDVQGSYTDPLGPDASREMLRFFLEHQHG